MSHYSFHIYSVLNLLTSSLITQKREVIVALAIHYNFRLYLSCRNERTVEVVPHRYDWPGFRLHTLILILPFSAYKFSV